MAEIRKTAEFDKWLDDLRDTKARAKVLVRIQRLAGGNPGDVGPVGDGISEMRIDYGPGYRRITNRKATPRFFFSAATRTRRRPTS
jgi:putative addiction module killer protein